ncbi:MAG: glycosyltransferase family 2 protein [Paludibacteraceae bacterium]
MMKRKKSVSVVIPNYKGKDMLKVLLPPLISILERSGSVSLYEIIVVDDASEDDTENLLSVSFPIVRFLRNDRNLGFSKTINRGVFSSSMDLVLLLNNDMFIADDFFEKTIPYFFKEDTFAVFSQIRDRDGEKIIEGNKRPFFKRGMLHYKEDADSKSGYTLYVCGGNALVDSQKIRDIKGFNELFSPFYFEDFDLSVRAWRLGWKCYYTSETYCRHCHSVTIKSHFEESAVRRIFVRNKLLFSYLNEDRMGTFCLLFRVMFKILLSVLVPSRSKIEYRRSACEFLKMYRSANREKNAVYRKLPSIRSVCETYFNSFL